MACLAIFFFSCEEEIAAVSIILGHVFALPIRIGGFDGWSTDPAALPGTPLFPPVVRVYLYGLHDNPGSVLRVFFSGGRVPFLFCLRLNGGHIHQSVIDDQSCVLNITCILWMKYYIRLRFFL